MNKVTAQIVQAVVINLVCLYVLSLLKSGQATGSNASVETTDADGNYV